MLDLTIRPQARRDLREIWRYTRRTWSRDQADRYSKTINAAIAELRREPERGQPCDEISKGLRRRKAERHVVYYRTPGKKLIIVRVLHDQMDPMAHLANDET